MAKNDIKRICIIGCSGSGKTTIGKCLSAKLNLPLFDLDDVAWLPGWKLRERDSERQIVENIVHKKRWIIVGNYSRYRLLTWFNADFIIWLDLPLFTCVSRGFRRAISNIWHGLPICNGNYDSWNRLFSLNNKSIIYWIITTHKEKRDRYCSLLDHRKDEALPPHVRLRTEKDVKQFIHTLEKDTQKLFGQK